MNWYSRQESHLQPPRSKRGALIIAPREQKGRRKIAESRRSRVVRTTPERLKDFSIRFLPSKLKWSRRRDSHSRGAVARPFTKLLLSLLSHIGKMVGRHGFAPCSRRLRAGTSLAQSLQPEIDATRRRS